MNPIEYSIMRLGDGPIARSASAMLGLVDGGGYDKLKGDSGSAQELEEVVVDIAGPAAPPATLPAMETVVRATPLKPITRKQILYLLLFQGVGSGAITFGINFLIAYLMYRDLPNNTIPFSGSLTCIVSDVAVTAFLVPCLTCIIGYGLIRNDLRVGKLISPIAHRYLDLTLLRNIPNGQNWVDVVKRSIMFGVIGVVLFAPLTLIFIYIATGDNGMAAVWPYILFKGYWGAVEATLLAPVLAFVVVAQDVYEQPTQLQ